MCLGPEGASLSTSDILDDMRTTLDIPEPLMEEAKRLLGYQSKTDVVILALQELIRRRKIEELKGLAGRVALEVDLARTRGRRPRQRRR